MTIRGERKCYCPSQQKACLTLTRVSWTIKGQPNEDAVLCTADKTYTIRSVVLSNSVLVVTPPPKAGSQSLPHELKIDEHDVIIRDQVSEVFELVPSVPRLHRLEGMLRGREYDEGHEEDSDEDMSSDAEGERPVSPVR